MSLARLQHEVEELRRRIEELKMKLTVEMKVNETDVFLFCFGSFTRSDKVAPRRQLMNLFTGD